MAIMILAHAYILVGVVSILDDLDEEFMFPIALNPLPSSLLVTV